MEPKYTTLKAIYDIVKEETNPLIYACFPNQVILHQSQPWDTVMEQLQQLATDGLSTIHQPGTTICLTELGMQKAETVKSF